MVRGERVSYVDVIVFARLAVDSSSDRGESAGLIIQFSARYGAVAAHVNLCRLRDLMTRGGGRGERSGMANSMKPCSAMKGADDCEKEVICCHFFVHI